MVTRAPFLKTRYGGYFHRDIPEEDTELTHVGPGTPCGEYLRRFWQPICFSDELRDLPRRVTILGEELVAFRDLSGAVGLLELHCPHRGTSHEFGLVGAEGIRCCYHGWLFAADGRILETPGEPVGSSLKDRLYHGAYLLHEHSGIIFAYLGPPDRQPPFPQYDSFSRPRYRLIPGRQYFYPCNWLQIMENAMDPAHTAFLHTMVSGAVFTDEFSVLPELDFVDTPIGMIYIATRRLGDKCLGADGGSPPPQPAAGGADLGRRPLRASFSDPMMSRWIVPVDDTNTMFIEFPHVSETGGVTRRGGSIAASCCPVSWPPNPTRRVGGTRATMRPGLTAADRPPRTRAPRCYGSGVSMFRNQFRRGIRAVRTGDDAVGLSRDPGAVIPTYCNDTVVRAPEAYDLEMDRKMMRETGRRLAEAYFREPPMMKGAVTR
jgi:nitrite reductase/ring-hydroxylating ferredoxin subunit